MNLTRTKKDCHHKTHDAMASADPVYSIIPFFPWWSIQSMRLKKYFFFPLGILIIFAISIPLEFSHNRLVFFLPVSVYSLNIDFTFEWIDAISLRKIVWGAKDRQCVCVSVCMFLCEVSWKLIAHCSLLHVHSWYSCTVWIVIRFTHSKINGERQSC